jgi:hypothetical protein
LYLIGRRNDKLKLEGEKMKYLTTLDTFENLTAQYNNANIGSEKLDACYTIKKFFETTEKTNLVNLYNILLVRTSDYATYRQTYAITGLSFSKHLSSLFPNKTVNLNKKTGIN